MTTKSPSAQFHNYYSLDRYYTDLLFSFSGERKERVFGFLNKRIIKLDNQSRIYTQEKSWNLIELALTAGTAFYELQDI